eukprot:CAMPEP_0116865192 /NCGR_PEP_ID=MMETSP0418-20121206/25259_1 /TAXON_ID=1158023 /ORGANISM="Astrosyne radiata, Strain 13vi08-1A" /LENGTH=102 /DNA_ID=CAMNT_0004500533 /DNA_START=251 /DNA_END=557 /DNA_ORIENTATION=-
MRIKKSCFEFVSDCRHTPRHDSNDNKCDILGWDELGETRMPVRMYPDTFFAIQTRESDSWNNDSAPRTWEAFAFHGNNGGKHDFSGLPSESDPARAARTLKD